MKKSITIFLIVLIILVIIAFAFIYIYQIKPNANYIKNADNLTVSPKSLLENRNDCIHFLNTGSSDAILLESDGHYALIDAAEDSDNPRGFENLNYKGYEQQVLDYLKKNAAAENGTVTLDFILGTHSHSDHIGGFDTIISDDDIKINKAYLKEYHENRIIDKEVEEWDNKEVYEQMVNALNEKNVPIISNMDSTPFYLGNFKITLFNTEDDNSDSVGENDNSLGVLVESNGARIFLAGDIDNITNDEDNLAPMIGNVDVLKVGHHSYSHSTTSNWLKTLYPSTCIITNSFEHADKRTIRRITRVSKSAILLTGDENGIILTIDDNGEIKYYNDIY